MPVEKIASNILVLQVLIVFFILCCSMISKLCEMHTQG
jgi:hypothetical protein